MSAVSHGAVIAVPVKVWPTENHVAAFMHKDVYGEFAWHVCHLMVCKLNTIAFFVGPSGMGPQALSPSLTGASVDDVNRFGCSILVVIVARKIY